jgi:hypothetical protein
MKKLNGFPFYCFIFALYPPIALIASNITEEELTNMLRPVFFSIIFAVFLFLITLLIIRNTARAGLITLSAQILFFSFGHILQSLEPVNVGGFEPGRIRILGPLFIILFVTVLWFIVKAKRIPQLLNQTLTVISVALLIFPVITTVGFYFQQNPSRSTNTASNDESTHNTINKNLPDIYYIIPDSYTRADVLADVYSYDNEPLLSELRQRGFYIADCSMSNYQYTLLSLSTTLNMEYLDTLDPRSTRGGYAEKTMKDLIQHNLVRNQLAQAGYKFIAFEDDYIGTQIPDADLYVRYKQPKGTDYSGQYINPFEEMFIRTTAGISLYRLELGPISDWIDKISYPYYKRAQIQLFQIETLPEIAKIPGPKFVFIHMNIPHRPFIFTPEGNLQTASEFYRDNPETSREEYQIKGYRDQVEFVNTKLPSMVDNILTASTSDPVILIQGDHGLDVANRSYILNAYHVPDDVEQQLYPSITPVNSFRIILNSILGLNEPLLPDRSYYSDDLHRFDISEVFETRDGCKK